MHDAQDATGFTLLGSGSRIVGHPGDILEQLEPLGATQGTLQAADFDSEAVIKGLGRVPQFGTQRIADQLGVSRYQVRAALEGRGSGSSPLSAAATASIGGLTLPIIAAIAILVGLAAWLLGGDR